MNSKNSSQDFEQLVERIERALKHRDAKITWNQQLKDVDVANLERQIDVLIEENGRKIIVECRKHKKPQNIQWIEQLFGKRKSVDADGVIAVSSSGFSVSALEKAKALGIITRNIEDITEKEITTWTNFREMEIVFIKFFDINIYAEIYKIHKTLVVDFENLQLDNTKLNPIAQLLEKVALAEGDKIIDKKRYLVSEHTLPPGKMKIDGVPCRSFRVSLKARPQKKCVSVFCVQKFQNSQTTKAEHLAIVERHNDSKTELITTASSVSWVADLSIVQPSKNCVFHDVRILGVNIPGEMSVNVIGTESLESVGAVSAQMNVKFV